MTDARNVLDQLDALIKTKSILNHPFYVAWERGELTKEQLATYATMYYPHVAAFPQYLVTTAAMAHDPEVRAEIDRNLADELNHPKPHNELWLDFVEGLGEDRSAVANAPAHDAATNMIHTFIHLAQKNAACGLAALYAYESQQPEVSRAKADGLKERYATDDEKTLGYFEVHAETDILHREGERKALERLLTNGADSDEVIQAAEKALEAYWGLLDGVCAEAGIMVEC